MFKNTKITDWIIAGAVAYTAYNVVNVAKMAQSKLEEVADAITHPGKTLREKLTPKKSETVRKVSDRVSSWTNRFFNK